ncbi:molybdopterin molybdenumtransferase MoeA [Apibacter muscae]|uniref:molybdopterin molybdotransferase MoeA n=1 Tax=Apibacter muscae TaxID=2509004 RepID=UPI0011AD7627|nr:molybdopterin molybdotransferase MoeA [Apibacter muscae]TWP23772.1 molybdopterin molybdenumtransferase MoeA [Apibacter muscae]
MNFITVSQAKDIVKSEIYEGSMVKKNLEEALYHYTAEDIYAPLDVPSFDNSAMDGYAFNYEQYKEKIPLKISYTIQAGATDLPILKKGEVARIYTGAPIPKGVDTVVMQEKIKENLGELQIQDSKIFQGMNVRLKASQTKKGDLLVPKNTFINSGIIGFLAGFGFTQLPVYAFPKVGLIVTGNELVEAGKPLQQGQIYESNSQALKALLQDINIQPHKIVKVLDDKDSTIETIQDFWEEVDILIMTGGISVGDYDFVKEALEISGVEKLFYKIQQKPGKPIFFGKKKNKYVFALPGNPASVLINFYQYVRPFLEGIQGNLNFNKSKRTARLATAYKKENTLTLFLKAIYKQGKVCLLPTQESYKMDAFTKANCLVELHGDPRLIEESEEVTLWKI